MRKNIRGDQRFAVDFLRKGVYDKENFGKEEVDMSMLVFNDRIIVLGGRLAPGRTAQ